MILIDTALQERQRAGNPIRVGLIGAGYMGRGITLQVLTSVPGMRLAAISNRTLPAAEKAYRDAGADSVVSVSGTTELEDAIATNSYAVTHEPSFLCRARNIDVIIEATGTVDFGAGVALQAIDGGKHLVLMNAELDATLGPILKLHADRAGTIFTNTDGDQPGVLMNLIRFTRTLGYEPVLAGNIKGLLDPQRTPKTQKEFAEEYNQKPRMVTSYADGTKLAMEMGVVANATGFKVGTRGMYGPVCEHVSEAVDLFPKNDLLEQGRVDYVLGAEPGPGVFLLGYNEHPVKREYMRYLKMGDGPFYVFYTPYHLPHLEVPLTAARAVLFHDATITPTHGPVGEVITVAKRDLEAGERLDGIGGFTCYGVLENREIARRERFLPMGLSDSCEVTTPIQEGQPIRYDDVHLPADRLCDRLRAQQDEHFDTMELQTPSSISTAEAARVTSPDTGSH